MLCNRTHRNKLSFSIWIWNKRIEWKRFAFSSVATWDQQEHGYGGVSAWQIPQSCVEQDEDSTDLWAQLTLIQWCQWKNKSQNQHRVFYVSFLFPAGSAAVPRHCVEEAAQQSSMLERTKAVLCIFGQDLLHFQCRASWGAAQAHFPALREALVPRSGAGLRFYWNCLYNPVMGSRNNSSGGTQSR